MGTLSDQDTIDTFAAGAKEVYEHWQENTPVANQNAIINLLRTAVRNTTVRPFAYSFKDFSNGSGGQLSSGSWTLEINRAYTNQHDLPEYLFKWLCGILYHEARHGEQYFCCAQGVHIGDLVLPTALSGIGTKSQQIGAAMGISDKAVTDAENIGSYRLKSVGEKNTVKAWFNSVWGTQSGHRSAVYTMPNLFTAGSAGNIAYTSLPEEVDAYAIQAAVEAAIDIAIAGVTQIVVAPKTVVSATAKATISATLGPKPIVPKAPVTGSSSTPAKVTPPSGLPKPDAVKPPAKKGLLASLAGLFSKG
jgi:hypothetical protein